MLRLAQVIAVHPSRRTIDICYLDNGYRAAEIRVMASAASSIAGIWDVPDAPAPQTEAQAGGLPPTGLQLIAVVAPAGRRPLVLGFLAPKGGTVAFTEQNRDIKLHPSGAYTTVAPDGSIEAWHPGGAYLRIGTGAHQDLATVAANGWPEPPPAAPAQITLITQGFSFTALPNGQFTLANTGDVDVISQGKLSVVSKGDMSLSSSEGNLSLAAAGELSLSGATVVGTVGEGGTGSATWNGGINTTKDVVAGTVSVQNHITTGVMHGDETSGPPEAGT